MCDASFSPQPSHVGSNGGRVSWVRELQKAESRFAEGKGGAEAACTAPRSIGRGANIEHDACRCEAVDDSQQPHTHKGIGHKIRELAIAQSCCWAINLDVVATGV